MQTLREQFHSVKGAELSHENMTEEGLKSRLSSDNPCILTFSIARIFYVRGTRTQLLICVGCSVHYWVSCVINEGGFCEIAFVVVVDTLGNLRTTTKFTTTTSVDWERTGTRTSVSA